MNPNGPASRTRDIGFLSRLIRFLFVPDKRAYRSTGLAIVMLILGLAMFSWNALFALAAGSEYWYMYVIGSGLVLLALSDFLLGRGVEWAVIILWSVALLCSLTVFVGFVLEAVGGSGIAVFAIVFGLACAALALVVGKARYGSRVAP